ncbi:MAG: anthranilate synthase component I family protein [Bacteroidaceae bacterium]|nr:anthranilate synthase component I family protein [Bacteroidaceae bacterium]
MPQYIYNAKSKTILSDRYTPVNTYMKVRDLYPQSCLMESSDYHSEVNSRSFVCFNPIAKISIGHGIATLTYPDGSSERRTISDAYPVEAAFKEFTSHFCIEDNEKGYCGMYGYTAFDAVRYFEHIPVRDETAEKNDAPDILYILYKNIIVFNHYGDTMDIIELLTDGEEDHTDNIQTLLNSPNAPAYGFHTVGPCTSTLTDEEHKANIRKCIKHCLRGDVFQIVPSRRFIQKYEGDDLRLYRALRSINPSPYLFYFDFGGFRIFGSSPETHCCIKGRKAYIDPIAGTVPRTGNSEQDREGAEYLRKDPKENAEHVMLVDLARNDLSRNCHNVNVEKYKEMQFYSHVIHLVSRVAGELDEEADGVKAFIDTFPAGTLSGAPKVEAMKIISRLEPHSRGAYAGCIGFMGLDGQLNQAIIIRSFVSRNGELWFQAGSGVVAKSNDEYELQEVNHKLGALRKAIALAGEE